MWVKARHSYILGFNVMIKITKPLLFILIFVFIIWPMGFLFFRAQSPEAKGVAAIVSTKGFLSTLQNKNADACLAMTYMNRVDVVIVGSSLAYANIDPLVLTEQFGEQSVAVCALSGWNTDFFELFFKLLKDNNIAPKRIVWLADGSSNIKFKIHKKRVENAKNVIFNDEFRNKTAQRWTETLGTKKQSREKLTIYKDRLARHSNRLSALSNDDVTQIILDTDFKSEIAVAVIAETAQPLPRNEHKLQKLCANIRQRSIVFDIVIAPSPTTTNTDDFTELFEPSNSVEDSPVASYYKDNVDCARSIISASLEDWGLDNRYYINRGLRDDFPYDMWEDPALFSSRYDALSSREQRWFYDSSHLNGVGAVIFTREFVKQLR